MRGAIDNEQSVTAYLALSSKALLRNTLEQSRLMRDTLESVRFDETARIRELVSQQRARRDQSITGNGHGLAMAAACAGMSPLSQLNHELSGLAGIRKLRALDDSLQDKDALSGFADNLTGAEPELRVKQVQFRLRDAIGIIYNGLGTYDLLF